MKKFGVFILFVSAILLSKTSFAQASQDTIFNINDEQIVSRIIKSAEQEIECTKSVDPDAGVLAVSKENARQTPYSDSTVEVFTRDKQNMNFKSEIVEKRQAVKFHLFAPLYDYLALTYEKSIFTGTIIELTAGYINSSIINLEYNKPISGVFFGSGVKINTGNSFYMKDPENAQPLKGLYMKPEILYSGYTVRNIKYYIVSGYYPNQTDSTYISNKNINSCCLMFNYGYQYIVGNILSIGCSVGFGYSIGWSSFSNDEMVNVMNQNDSEYSSDWNYDASMYSYVRFGRKNVIALSCAITIGYIFK